MQRRCWLFIYLVIYTSLCCEPVLLYVLVLGSTKIKYDKIKKEEEEEEDTWEHRIYRQKSMPSHLVMGAMT